MSLDQPGLISAHYKTVLAVPARAPHSQYCFEGKSYLHFYSVGGNRYKLLWHHCYLSNQYQVGFSLLNEKKYLIFEII